MMVLNIYDSNMSKGIMCSLWALCRSVCRTESVAEKMLTNWFTFLLYKFLKVTFTDIHYQVKWLVDVIVR